MSAHDHPSVRKFAEHVNPALVRLLGAFGYTRAFVRAKGTKLWDDEGREYLDFVAALGAANLGHNPPRLIEALARVASDEAPNLMHVGPQLHAAELAAELAKRTSPLERCLFSTSGGEAIDAAIKLARAATRRKVVLYCRGGSHGKGLGPLSIAGTGRARDLFEPLVPSCFEVAFDDLEALERALTKHKGEVAAFVVEPIQCDAGVVVPEGGYLKAAYALTAKHGALFVLDETETGLGRTGRLFGHQGEGLVPDVLVLGKSLGGGLLPVSATLTTPDIHDRAFGRVDRFDLHGSTFSGYALGSRVAMEVLAAIDDERLPAAAAARGARLTEGLRDRVSGHPFVRAVRGRGLLVGLELGPARRRGRLGRLLSGVVSGVSRSVLGQWLAVRLLERGIVAQPAAHQWNVLKLTPPLTVTEEEIDVVVDAIGSILDSHTELPLLLADVGQRLGAQFLTGFTR
jgi:putrescine aminotransferase